MDYELVTDSCCNLSNDLIEKNNLHIIPLYYIVNGEEKLSYSKDEEQNLKQYYTMMRNKTPMSTSCASREIALPLFEQILNAGKNLIYVGFSSALSATYSVIANLLDELKPKYPKQKIYYVDSLCASLGQGLLVVSAAKMRENGASLSDVYDFLQDNKLKLCHLFTVDTLANIYRGGRVKKSAYLLASTLNIKPVLHVDNGGNLTAVSKVFGRKGSLNAMAKLVAQTIKNPENQTIYISHGDCIEDVEYVVSRLKEKFNFQGVEINYVDLVVGTHSGPGTLAIFYFADNREI